MADPLDIATIIASVLLYVFLPPLLDGVERKIKADIQSRYGPPTIFQTWFDILKLMSKEVVIPINYIFYIVPISLSFTLSIVLSVIMSQIITLSNMSLMKIISVFVFLTSIHVLNMLTYLFSSNPFSIIGTFRVMTLNILNEVGLALFLILMFIVVTNSPCSIMLSLFTITPLTIAVYISHGRLPYDLHEAEPELASGSLIEFSGPILGLYLYSHLIERYILTSLPILFIIYMFKVFQNVFVMSLVFHVFTIVLYIIFAVVSVILGRSKVNLAVKTLAFLYFLAIIIWIGVYIVERII
ncbi:MAG: NADH-quinone oxidoreductase subunit H [Ignisphaera sp.]